MSIRPQPSIEARSWRRAGALAVTVAALVVTAVLWPARAPSREQQANGQAGSGGHAVTAVPAAREPVAGGASPVGVLFTRPRGHLGSHFCTASVVTSPGGNLLITAAHCLTGISVSPAGRLVFAPDYAGGQFGRGLWEVTRKFVDARWAANHDPNDDVAFLEVRPLAPASDGSVQRTAGADQIRFDAPLPTPIWAIGYPNVGAVPIVCLSRAVAFRLGSLDQVRFACPGFTAGTSGGPMLTGYQSATGTGAVIGVIGGYQQGGDSPSVSYSSAFGAAIKALYTRATLASSSRPHA